MTDDLNLEEVYKKYWEYTNSMIEQGHRPLAVAGVMLAQSLSMYKTILKPSEFEIMMDTISESRDEVKSLKIDTQLQ